jgi:DNA repair protein RecN (Recombination protein N)
VLRELHVRNLAVIESASIEWQAGFAVLSGETGAGKSIVVDSLSLLAGARASVEMIRSGAEGLSVAGVFSPRGDAWRRVLDEAGLDATGEELLIRREIAKNGRNRVFVNDQPATLRLLADLAPLVLRIHGQREELGLTTPDLQRWWLDRSGGAEAERLLARVAETHERWSRLAERLARASGDQKARRERLDLLRFHSEEIDAAHLVAGEDEKLRIEREGLRHADAIARALGASQATLSEDEGAAVERLGRARELLSGIVDWQPEAGGWLADLMEIEVRLADLAQTLAHHLDGLEADPVRLDSVEERLALVERLGRRFGGSVAAVLAYRAAIEEELAELDADAADRSDLFVRVEEALGAYREEALALSAARRVWGRELVQRIAAECKDLGLAKARLEVALERRKRAGGTLIIDGVEVEPGREGIDQVVFLFAPNPGEEPRPLARIASGGELSRLFLALQLAAKSEGAEATLVFDEVDSGIGGAEAAALGKKLQRLARGGQILAVTHLAQVASAADRHYRVAKKVTGGRTRVAVEALDAAGRIEEVARMLAGSKVTDLSLSHARELIAGAARK